jgi:hypothetical protein
MASAAPLVPATIAILRNQTAPISARVCSDVRRLHGTEPPSAVGGQAEAVHSRGVRSQPACVALSLVLVLGRADVHAGGRLPRSTGRERLLAGLTLTIVALRMSGRSVVDRRKRRRAARRVPFWGGARSPVVDFSLFTHRAFAGVDHRVTEHGDMPLLSSCRSSSTGFATWARGPWARHCWR